MIKVNNITEAPNNYYAMHFDGEFYIFFESKEERELFMASFPVPEKVEEPIIVALWQLRLYLAEIGMKPQIEAIIDTLVDPLVKLRVLSVWEYGNTINSESPLIKMLAHEMGLSKEEVKEIFTNANNIEL